MSQTTNTTANNISISPFLINLKNSFNVDNPGLAIFILVIICLLCILTVIFVILCVRLYMRRRFQQVKYPRRLRGMYMDELPDVAKAAYKGGDLTFTVGCDLNTRKIRVNVIEARNLPTVPNQPAHDSCVAVTLLKSDKKSTQKIDVVKKTDVKWKSNHPVWHKEFVFHAGRIDFAQLSLHFEVFHYDLDGEDISIGQVCVPFTDIDMEQFFVGPVEVTYPLSTGNPPVTGIGQLCVGIAYHNQQENLEICIFEARRLMVKQLQHTSKKQALTVFVELYRNGRALSSFETKSRNDLTEPYFNEKFIFPVKVSDLRKIDLKCFLRSYGNFGQKRDLGELHIGPSTKMTTGEKQWSEMLKLMETMHVRWHCLVPKRS